MLSVAFIIFAGLVALCLAMDKHFSELLKRKPTALQSRALRWAGWVLLVVSLVLAVNLRGLAFGLVEWFALVMAGLTLWVFGLPYQPRLLLGLALVSVVLGPVLAVVGV